MTLRRFLTILTFAASLLTLLMFVAGPHKLSTRIAFAQSDEGDRHCVPVAGTVMTNLATIGQSTTLGTATGDLKGAVAATILNVSPGPHGTTLFSVQHHWVTEAGDTLLFDPALATVVPVTPTLFAVVTYPLKLIGGTGRFEGATGTFDHTMGEIDVPNFPSLAGGRTVFRISGNVCFDPRHE
jgi:hypothetical protein